MTSDAIAVLLTFAMALTAFAVYATWRLSAQLEEMREQLRDLEDSL